MPARRWHSSGIRLLALLAATAAVVAGDAVWPVRPQPTTPTGAARAEHSATGSSAARGRLLYRKGLSARGQPVMASVLGIAPVPASHYPCLLCHGADGRGAWEAGAQVPEIRWSHLGAPARQSGRERDRPPYTVPGLARALRHGTNPAGRLLEPPMPRYIMADDDLADLVAYLGVVGSEDAPGTSSTGIRVGVLLPLWGPRAPDSAVIRRLLEHTAARINDRGGIYGRRLDLVVRDSGSTEHEAVAAATELLDPDDPAQSVFCFLASSGAGAGAAVEQLLEQRHVPSIGPLVLPRTSADTDRRNRYVFYLFGGAGDHASAAARYLSELSEHSNDLARQEVGTHRGSAGAPIALLTAAGEPARQLASVFMDHARQHRLPVLDAAGLDPGDMAGRVTRLRALGARIIVLMTGTDAANAFLAETARQQWTPSVLVFSVLMDGRLEPHGRAITVVAPGIGASLWPLPSRLPSLPVPVPDQPMQLAALASAELLVAGLEMAGRDLDRDALVAALERARNLATGLTPPLTFDRIRRQGSRGAQIIRYSPDARVIHRAWIGID